MAITAAFLAVVAVIVGWWLSHQRLARKPWLELGMIGDLPDAGVPRVPAAKIGLGVFLAVAGSLFALFASTYPNARASGHGLASHPRAAASVAQHRCAGREQRGAARCPGRRASRPDGSRAGRPAGGGVLAVAFLAGQLLAWRELVAAGYSLASNPANSFFYLLTAVHGLHVLGGLVALARAIARGWRGSRLTRYG